MIYIYFIGSSTSIGKIMVCDEDVLLCSDELNPPQDENTQVGSSTNSKSKKRKLDWETWYRYKYVEDWRNCKIENNFRRKIYYRSINVACVLCIELLIIVGCSRMSAFNLLNIVLLNYTIFVTVFYWQWCTATKLLVRD